MFVTLYDSTAMWKKVIIFNLAKKVTNYIFNCNEPNTTECNFLHQTLQLTLLAIVLTVKDH